MQGPYLEGRLMSEESDVQPQEPKTSARNPLRTVDSLKEEILALVRASNDLEVTRSTSNGAAGIYMIYVDDFSDELVIPIYIGQTKNFQRRYRQHLSEIMSLNRLGHDYYRMLVCNGFYEGHYRACKVFKYMVEHSCSLQDFHMIVLEKTEDYEALDRMEQSYFNRYHPSLFGFNQLDSLLAFRRLFVHQREMPSGEQYVALCGLVERDMNDIRACFRYGFTEFNYLWVFIENIPDSGALDEDALALSSRINDELAEVRRQLLPQPEKVFCAECERNRLELAENHEAEEVLFKELESTKDRIHRRTLDLFAEHKIGSRKAREDFVDGRQPNGSKRRESFLSYLRNREIDFDFYLALDDDIKVLLDTDDRLKRSRESRRQLNDTQCALLDDRRLRILQMLAPEKEYVSFPLKDMYRSHGFANVPRTDHVVCDVNLAISNNGRNKHPEIVKIDYRISSPSSAIESKDVFVRCLATTLMSSEQTSYQERDFLVPFSRERFNVRLSLTHDYPLDEFDFVDTFISVNAELRTGINDCSVRGRILRDLHEVFCEIEEQLADDCVYRFSFSESKPCVRRCLDGLGRDTLRLRVVQALIDFVAP